MARAIAPGTAARRLRAVRLLHTGVWAFFVACIVLAPLLAWQGHGRAAVWALGLVAVETAVLALNGMRCPLTDVAARYTDDRRPNFDIYLPEWLARWNKHVFGPLFVLAIALVAARLL
jgi:hypothetical protein